MTDDPVAETIERLSRGSAEALLDPGATDLVARLRAAAFRESGGGLGVGVREAHTLLALGWARFVLLRGADRPEAGDELHDVVELFAVRRSSRREKNRILKSNSAEVDAESTVTSTGDVRSAHCPVALVRR